MTSIVYVPTLKMFVAAALDMTFKLFSYDFKPIEVIPHEERAVLVMEYFAKDDVIVMAGAQGVGVWRLWRPPKVGHSMQKQPYTMERLYTFSEIDECWINGLQIDTSTAEVFALSGNSAYVLSLQRKNVKHSLKNVHDLPITCVCWYGRSQFFMTGCMGGLIKCWTSFHYQSGKTAHADHRGREKRSDPDYAALSLLHTFTVHTAAVAGIVLHPTSGMAISASMDGIIRVLNLEMFTEIYSINLHGRGISRLTTIVLPPAPNSAGERVPGAPPGKGILFTHADDNSICLWRVTSCAGFFGISSSDVISLRRFENMHAPVLFTPLYSNPHIDCRVAKDGDKPFLAQLTDLDEIEKDKQRQLTYEKYLVKQKEMAERKLKEAKETDLLKRTMGKVAGAFASFTTTFKVDTFVLNRKLNEGALDDMVPKDKAEEEAVGTPSKAAKAAKTATITSTPVSNAAAVNGAKLQGPFRDNVYVGSLAERDLRLFTGKGRTITSVDPDIVVQGIVCYTVSVYQHLVFALLEAGDIVVFCARSGSVPGEWSTHLRTMPHWRNGSVNVEHEDVVTMTLINIMPSSTLKPPSDHNARYNKDMRGQPIPVGVDELVVMGCRSGVLLFLDTMNECRIVKVLQAHQQQVDQVEYRHVRRELFTLGKVGKDTSAGSTCDSVIRVWSLPSLRCICEVKALANVSPMVTYPNAFAISDHLPFFAVGCIDGDVRVFVVMPPSNKAQDATKQKLGKVGTATSQYTEKDFGFGLAEGPAEIGLPSAGSRSVAANYRVAAGLDVGEVGFGFMEVVLRNGNNHESTVTAISFCDELQLYASADSSKVVKIWTCEKQIIRTIKYNMPTVCLLFNSATAVGDCIFTQYSYLLNIQRRIWDDGGALAGVRDKRELWDDKGIGAGLFVADAAQKSKGKSKGVFSSFQQPVPPQEESAYYTRRGGKFIRGINDPSNPMYLEAQAQKQSDGRRQRTDSNNHAAKRPYWDQKATGRNTPHLDTVFLRGTHQWEYENDEDYVEIDTCSPRMLLQNKPRELSEETDGLLVTSTLDDIQRFAQITMSPGPTSRKGIPSERLSASQVRMSVFGAGKRGAALLLASPRPEQEEDLLSVDAIQYSATETEAYLTLTGDETTDDVVFHDPVSSPGPAGMQSRKSLAAPPVLPSAIIRAAQEADDDDDEVADIAHAHFGDKHHFDMTDRQRKAMQQQMHRRRHRMGRSDKENKQLLDLGASGVVSDAFRHAKLAHRKNMQDKANVLNLGVSRQRPIPMPSLLGSVASAHKQRAGAAPSASLDYAIVPEYVPVRPADAPPSKQPPVKLHHVNGI